MMGVVNLVVINAMDVQTKVAIIASRVLIIVIKRMENVLSATLHVIIVMVKDLKTVYNVTIIFSSMKEHVYLYAMMTMIMKMVRA